MKLVVIVLLVVIIMSQPPVKAVDTIADLAQKAEAAYIKGEYKVAADLYQQLLDQGVKSSEVYFNLGNTYYQLHDLGRALVNYRRVETFVPRDEDLRLNIARILVQRLDGTPAESGIEGQITRLTSDWLSTSELGWIVITLWWLCCGGIVAYLRRPDWRKRLRWGILVSSALFILVGTLALARTVVDSTMKPAVIVSNIVSVMSGPGTNYLEIYELHAAAEVRIIEERSHWVRFQLPDLREGWIEEQSREVI